MTRTFRLRLSLLVRMGIALMILASLSAMLAVGVVITGGILGFFIAIPLPYLHEFLMVLPRLTWVTKVSGLVVVPVAAGSCLACAWLWTKTPGFRNQEYLLPPSGPLSWGFFLGGLGTLYLVAVETTVLVATTLSSAVGENWSNLVLLIGVLLVAVATLIFARKSRRDLYDQLTSDCRPATEQYPELDSTARKLALQAEITEPAVCVVDRDRPESFTIGNGDDATIVVSTGLVDLLSTAELQAVLAHEVSHLANADSRIMGMALLPVLVADNWVESDSVDPSDVPLNVLLRLLRGYGKLGVAVLSRGRELTADAGAASLTGSPATLASALARLDENRGTPQTDLREWEQSVAALDILPPADLRAYTGPFRMHPDTGDRIDRLRRMAANDESPV